MSYPLQPPVHPDDDPLTLEPGDEELIRADRRAIAETPWEPYAFDDPFDARVAARDRAAARASVEERRNA